MEKKSSNLIYPDNDPVTPFNKGKNGLTMADTIQGLQQKNARMWQIIAIVSLSSFFISLGIVVYAIHLPKTVPVIVTVNDEGRATYKGELDRSTYGKQNIPTIAKEYQIKKLVERMNTWVTDRNAQKLLIGDCQSIVQEGAVAELDTFFRENNPFDNFGQRIKTVLVDEPLQQSDNTYILYYTTQTKTKDGYIVAEQRYSMLVTLGFYQPSVNNPLGLYVTNFDIKKA